MGGALDSNFPIYLNYHQTESIINLINQLYFNDAHIKDLVELFVNDTPNVSVIFDRDSSQQSFENHSFVASDNTLSPYDLATFVKRDIARYGEYIGLFEDDENQMDLFIRQINPINIPLQETLKYNNKVAHYGVISDSFGRPEGYLLKLKNGNHQFVKANSIVHIRKAVDSGQIRGVSPILPAIPFILMLRDLLSISINKEKTSSGIVGVLVHSDNSISPTMDVEMSNLSDSGDEGDIADIKEALTQKQLKADGSNIFEIEKGMNLVPITISGVNAENIKILEKALLRGASRAVGLEYFLTSSDYDNNNFSSLNLGQNQNLKVFFTYQEALKRFYVALVKRWQAFSGDTSEYKIVLQDDVWITPKQKVDTIEKMLILGLTTREREWAKMGLNPNKMESELIAEKELKERLGI